MLTLVLGVDFNLERLYRREHGDPREARPQATGLAAVLGRVYDARLRAAGPARRVASSSGGCGGSAPARSSGSPTTTAPTLAVLANFGLSTQLAVLGVCLALERAGRRTCGSRSAAGSRSSRWSCGVNGGRRA